MTHTQRAAALRLADELQRFDGAERESLRDEAAALLRELAAEPPVNNDVAWLWTHCKALGMKRKSLSGSMRDDIALYVVDLRELAEPQGEPVAWLSRDEARLALWKAMTQRAFGNPTDDKLVLEALRKDGLWIGHLDAAPQQRKPLTRDEVRDLVKECGLDWHRGFMQLFEGDETNRFAVTFARAIERAHGITGEQE